ncbi:hypothetical protein D3C75_1315300 [compost metagenome]
MEVAREGTVFRFDRNLQKLRRINSKRREYKRSGLSLIGPSVDAEGFLTELCFYVKISNG